MATVKAGVKLVQEWTKIAGATPFLLRLTHDDLEAISLLACKDGHPLQEKALALLRAIYAIV